MVDIFGPVLANDDSAAKKMTFDQPAEVINLNSYLYFDDHVKSAGDETEISISPEFTDPRLVTDIAVESPNPGEYEPRMFLWRFGCSCRVTPV